MAFDLVEDIAVLIEAVLTGVTVKSELPDDVANCISISLTGGFPPTHTFSGGISSLQKPIFIEPSFQIACRNLSADTLNTWWDAIKIALDGKTNYTPTGKSLTYLVITQFGEVIPMGRDNNRRSIEVLNFNTMIINAY